MGKKESCRREGKDGDFCFIANHRPESASHVERAISSLRNWKATSASIGVQLDFLF